jgi:hypothetical protein
MMQLTTMVKEIEGLEKSLKIENYIDVCKN